MIKKTGLLFLMCALAKVAVSQDNLPAYDRQPIRFGFSIGYNSSDLRVFKKPDFVAPDSVLEINPMSGPGFNIGVVANILLFKYVDLRITPNLAFVDRTLNYTFANPKNNTIRSVESTYVEFPLSLKIRSARHRNVGFFVIGGMKYSYDVISPKKVSKGEDPFDPFSRKVKLKNSDLLYEWGFGWDFYYQYFKFSPEIKFAYGTRNLMKAEDHQFSRPIDQLFSRVLNLTFYFE